MEPIALQRWHHRSEIPIDIDIHLIPDNKSKAEPEHWHCDFRFVFEANGKELIAQAEEIANVAWLMIEDPRCEMSPRMASKLRAIDGR